MIKAKMYDTEGRLIHTQYYAKITNLKKGLTKRLNSEMYMIHINIEDTGEYILLFRENIENKTYKAYKLKTKSTELKEIYL